MGTREVKKIYDDNGEWIGMEIIETMPLAEARERYPELFEGKANNRG